MIWHISYEGLRKLVTQAKDKSFLQVPTINSYRRLFLHQFWIIYRFHLFWFRDNEIKRMSYYANIFQVQAQRLFDCHLIMESLFIPKFPITAFWWYHSFNFLSYFTFFDRMKRLQENFSKLFINISVFKIKVC